MPSLTRRALVTLAALGPVAARAPAGSAATGSGPPPTPPELEAFLDRGAYRGDLDVMLEKGVVRVLTAYSKTDFFVDKAPRPAASPTSTCARSRPSCASGSAPSVRRRWPSTSSRSAATA